MNWHMEESEDAIEIWSKEDGRDYLVAVVYGRDFEHARSLADLIIVAVAKAEVGER